MPDPVLAALAAACPGTRPAAADDAVAGVTPRYVAAPATVAGASALMRAAAGHGLAVLPRGGGSKLDWGAPPRRCDLVIEMGSLDRVIEHAAGDLVARVQAGVPVRRLAGILGKAGQQLAVDQPPSAPGNGAALAAGATVGGVLATGSAGPRRLRYGSPRDLVIGITVVRADGTVARSGGKVVKNVAGYDLGKLFAGSYGTLGLIVEAVFRLHPVPSAVAYVTGDYPGAAIAYQAVAAAAGSQLAPSAVEIDRSGRGQVVRVGVLLEGDPDGVTDRAELMRGLLGPGSRAAESAPGWWGWPAGPGQVPRAAETPNGRGQVGGPTGSAGEPAHAGAGTLIKIAFWAAAFAQVVAAIDAAGAATGLDPAVGGSAAAGVLYAAAGPDADPAAVAAFVSELRSLLGDAEHGARPAAVPRPDSPPLLASALIVQCPPRVLDAADPWGPVPSFGLMRAVKDQFDPEHRMAPGRFAGGL